MAWPTEDVKAGWGVSAEQREIMALVQAQLMDEIKLGGGAFPLLPLLLAQVLLWQRSHPVGSAWYHVEYWKLVHDALDVCEQLFNKRWE